MLTLFGIVAVALVSVVIGNALLKKSASTSTPSASTTITEPASMTADQLQAPAALADLQTLEAPTSKRLPPGSNPSSAALPAFSGPPEELVAQIVQVDVSRGAFTQAQAQQFKQSLQQLAAQGAAAIPAIRAFLEKNQDVNFGLASAPLAGVPTVRAGLLDALRQMGGPEALDLSRQVLKSTSDPLEIAMLAQNLEQAEPGQHAQEAVDSAKALLDQVAQGVITNVDVGPLFQVLQTYGGTTAAVDLEKLVPRWNSYALMALAGLPSGQGVASLIQIAKDSIAAGGGQSSFPLQMLAQLAPQYPDAATALLDFANQSQIPDRAWSRIGEGFAGDQYQFTRNLPDSTFAARTSSGLKTYHLVDGNQNYFSTPVSASGSVPDLGQRLNWLDQLLAASSSNPTAVQALLQARERLGGAPPHK
jgi:hypothetical protein